MVCVCVCVCCVCVLCVCVELIITAGGENVPPVLLEANILRELPFLSNVMIVGDRRPYLTCLMTLKVWCACVCVCVCVCVCA